ncbi:MAG: hypothetical protein JXL80_00350 [Planctomycetes bacterium]|nr:hypothetical protein [Planctomycetota bacterium]
MKRLTLIVVLAAALPTLGGCSFIDYMLVQTAKVFSPPPKTTPAYRLDGKNILILVDPASQDLLASSPRMPYAMARAIAQELSDHKAARSIVNPIDVVSYAQSEPLYAQMSVVDVGKAFKVDEVVQIIVTEYGLESTTGSDQYMGRVAIDLRVISVKKAKQVYPAMGQSQTIEARSSSGITAATRVEAEKTVMEGLAYKVGMVFAPYLVEERPMRSEVK